MYDALKRILDFLFALTAIIILFPIMAIIAIVIRIDSQGSVIFKQQRIGINKKIFCIYKFRTMRMDTPPNLATHLLANPESCITKTGSFLRKAGLDELPQLVNIIRGDMSIVGPRPALYNQHDLISERDFYGANSVPVGLTGWAQVNGRDNLSIQEKAKLDGDYVKARSLFFDFKIILRTISTIIKNESQ